MKKIKPIHIFALFIAILSFPILANGEAIIQWDESIDVMSDKTWTVKFNKSVDSTSVNSNSIYVIDQSGTKKNGNITVSMDGKQVIIAPPIGGYVHSSTYVLHITDKIKDKSGKPLSKYVQKKFTIEASQTYDIAQIQADGSTSFIKSYLTYEEAVTNWKTDQVIMHQGALIKMPAGLVVTKPTTSSVLTIIYSDKSFKQQDTYVPADTELLYVDSTDIYVEVNVAGKTAYIKHENSKLLPWNALKGRSYYSTVNGTLTHYIYSHNSGKYTFYNVGTAPNFMIAGENYYSVDGVHFTNASGQTVGTSYPYFQYLSARSKTNYSAEEIDAYIFTMLQKLEMENPYNATYKQASKKSKLIGLGNFLKQMEDEYHINALFILALAQHESAYGLSNRALEYNNLFGLYVTDNNPLAKYFDTVEQNIEELITKFLNKNYIPPNAGYAYGAAFGNKATGFNVKYASDPYWGAKAAGHLYRMDQMMGGKDSINPYKLGITTTSGLNVRTGPGTNYPVAYRYAKSNLLIIILDDSLPETDWVQVLSDSSSYKELYIHRDYIQAIPFK
ncbi:glucosaminidase domain-containing protein [Psychrobacillus sp. NPDC096426]|uniref:glucosaminidase domain-containing protein n=1 Tax=Psychrobacillus sp. NPDC096426 TaxID=3364491 RepID=UPI00382BE805